MGRNRFITPDTSTIDIGDGDWIEVKKHLTYGEYSKSQAALIKDVRSDGRVTPNFEMIGKAEVLAYLVDWSFCDAAGKVVKIETDGQREAAIDALAPEDMQVIRTAVTAHIAAMSEVLAAGKKSPGTPNASEAT